MAAHQVPGSKKFLQWHLTFSGPQRSNLLYSVLLVPRLLRWHLDFWKICATLKIIIVHRYVKHFW
jgi:hypothetical protein